MFISETVYDSEDEQARPVGQVRVTYDEPKGSGTRIQLIDDGQHILYEDSLRGLYWRMLEQPIWSARFFGHGRP